LISALSFVFPQRVAANLRRLSGSHWFSRGLTE
jgi:hypothetical protein